MVCRARVRQLVPALQDLTAAVILADRADDEASNAHS
jgi:hypothetical protein